MSFQKDGLALSRNNLTLGTPTTRDASRSAQAARGIFVTAYRLLIAT